MFKPCKGFLFLVAGLALFTAPHARAGTWQGPFYAVSQRNAAARGTDTAIPAGGGGSTVQGRIRTQGPLASGTVTARFIWLPDPKLASDPPPTTLTIAETGRSSWYEPYSTPKASPRLGVADDGLGHPAALGKGSRSGSSSGTLLRTYSVLNGAVTTDPVTLKAVASSAAHTYWRYSARVSPVEIKLTCNGEAITDSSHSVNVLSHMRFQFAAVVSSHGLPVTNPRWTLAPSKFACATGDGQRPLTEADLKQYALNTYYIGFVPQSASLPIYRYHLCQAVVANVMFTVTINGQPYSVRGEVRPYNRRA